MDSLVEMARVFLGWTSSVKSMTRYFYTCICLCLALSLSMCCLMTATSPELACDITFFKLSVSDVVGLSILHLVLSPDMLHWVGIWNLSKLQTACCSDKIKSQKL